MATETASTGRESDKFMLRFPEGMRALIKEAAEKNGRTMNAEIVARLQGSLDAAATARANVPRILETLDRALDHAAVERGVLKLNINTLGDAISLLVRLLDEGAGLQPDHRQRLLDLVARSKSDVADPGALLMKVQEELDSNAALTAELGMALIEEVELALNPRRIQPTNKLTK